jgi:hypothetical protein
MRDSRIDVPGTATAPSIVELRLHPQQPPPLHVRLPLKILEPTVTPIHLRHQLERRTRLPLHTYLDVMYRVAPRIPLLLLPAAIHLIPRKGQDLLSVIV